MPHSLLVIATDSGVRALQQPSVLNAMGVSITAARPLLRHAPANKSLAHQLKLDRVYVLTLADKLPAQKAQAVLARRTDLFDEVQINHTTVQHTDDNSNNENNRTPNDPMWPLQYSLYNTGQQVNGVPGLPGADIHVLEAWNGTQGSEDIVVAVFDAGISESHPDIVPKLVEGWNFIADNDETDDNNTSHGTHVAGIIAAMTGNRTGIAGVSWNSKIMPVKVLNKFGFGNESILAEGIIWAADHGARVGSVSIGYLPAPGSQEDQILHNAVLYATGQNMLIVASSGNTPSNPVAAPARYPETVAVGATDNRDELWINTATGPEMSVVAPGVSIWSTFDSEYKSPGENTYAQLTGTSQACPHVAGVAALVLAVNPDLSPLEVKDILERSADDLGPAGWDPQYGYGRINAQKAVHMAKQTKDDTTTSDPPCIADFNFDGQVNIADFTAYINAYNNENFRADLAEPKGVFNSLDLIAFMSAYAQGCGDRHLGKRRPQP